MNQLFLDLPTSRSEAQLIGASHYFTGKPCKNGHVDKRITGGGACSECVRVRQRDRLANDPKYRDLHRKSCRDRMRRVLSCPDNISRIRERDLELSRSPHRKAAKATADMARYERNRTDPDFVNTMRSKDRKRYQQLKDCPEFKAKEKARGAKWAKDNKDRCNAKTAIRRATRRRATPPWLTSEMKVECLKFYVDAQRLSRETGVPHEVDHVVPLHGNNVCGLHVPWNLQILTKQENRSKHNTVREDW